MPARATARKAASPKKNGFQTPALPKGKPESVGLSSSRLKALSAEEMHFRQMTLEGILAIQAGDNPRVVAEKLLAYVPPSIRPTEADASGAGAEKVAA